VVRAIQNDNPSQFDPVTAQMEPQFRLDKVKTEEERVSALNTVSAVHQSRLPNSGSEIARQAGAMNAADIAYWIG